jgi:tripartite-type tricarboxylate transporter receptor subunit TctC
MNTITQRLLIVLALFAGVSAAAQTGSAPLRIVVPFTPGTGMDTIARTVQPLLAERLGQSVVVVNMPGASGNIGADHVAKAAPDGNTVLMGANTMLMASQLYSQVSYDPLRDFAPVTMSAWGTLMLVAHPKTGIKSLAELLAAARAKPGALSYGSPGVGTPHHMATELFKLNNKLFMLHVPYRGTAGYTQDLLSGELNVGFLPVHVAQGMVKAGRLNALAVSSAKRHAIAPEVPTFAELGQNDLDVDLWYAFFVPVKTPPPMVARLHSELAAILQLPQVRDTLGRAGMDAASSTPEALAAIVAKDHPRWGRVIKAKGITAE